VISLLVGTKDTTQLLCSLQPDDCFVRTFTAWAWAVQRTLCLYALSYPGSLLHLRIVAILSATRRSVLRHVSWHRASLRLVASRRVSSRSLW